MSLARLKSIKASIDGLIEVYDNKGIIGPISYLEEAMENIDAAIEEYNEYIDCGAGGE